MNPISNVIVMPRIIRLKDAPDYLGMDKNRFNKDVRPYLIEIPYGTQCIGFDRLDLDAWLEQYKSCNGRPGLPIGEPSWDVKKHQGYEIVVGSGTLKNRSSAQKFTEALEQVASKKRN